MLKIVRICCCLVLLIMSITAAGNVPAHTKTLASLKAAYIYNIAKFTRWPARKVGPESAPVNLCTYGENDVAQELKTLHGRTLGSHPIRVLTPATEPDFTQCHILYVSPTEKRRYRYILSLIDIQSVLTISDDIRFTKSGGLISLVEVQQRLHFLINSELLSEQELQLSSKLLKIAVMIDSSR